MSALHLTRLVIDQPALMRFAQSQDLLRDEDDGHGYLLHAWLSAMFGSGSLKPFRLIEARGEVLGYTRQDADALREHAVGFASPVAWSALVSGSLVSKPMPEQWRAGLRLSMEVLTCPVSRKDDEEKDVFLRTLDRLGDASPSRGDVYVDWFRRQWMGAVDFEQIELAGMSRSRLLRRTHSDANTDARRRRSIERPSALFRSVAQIRDGDAFLELLARGIGRHRAFGFGMVLLHPPR